MAKKQGVKKSLSIYSTILAKSWQTVWSHKGLWIIAALAGLANTGAVFNRVLNSFWQIQPADQINLETVGSIFNLLPWSEAYLRQVITLGNVKLIITIAVWLILLTIAAVLIISAQQLILVHSHKQIRARKHLTLEKLKKELRHLHFWRILAVDTFVCLAINLVILISAIPLALLLQSTESINALIYLGFYLILLPLGFVINAWGMFTLIHLVRNKESLLTAARRAWGTLSKNWLVSFELAIILYLINFVFHLFFLVGIAIIAIPITIIIIASTSTGSFGLMTVLSVLGALILLALIVLLAGAITMFNYSTWAHLVDRLERYGLLPVLESLARKIKR